MPTATINGVGIHYELSGAGAPVLFLSGLGARGSHWRCQHRALERRYRVITFDHRGIGWSEAPPERAYTVAQMADDAVALLDHLGIERPHLVGVSMGSLVAQEMALCRGERVRSLTLAGAWAHTDARLRFVLESWASVTRRMPIDEWYRRVFLPSAVSPAFLANSRRVDRLVEHVFASAPGLQAETIERQVRGIVEWTGTRTAWLGEITAPALVLAGTDDTFAPPRLARALADALPNARFQEVPGGHCFITEYSRRFNETLLEFLDWLGASSA